MANAVDVVVRFLGDSSKATLAAKQVDDAYSKTARNLTRTGVAMAGAITLPLAAAAGAAFKELRNAEKIGAQTNAVLKSTGEVAGITKREVDALAQSISNKSGIDDEAIISAENMLLTFTRVRNEAGKGNDIFNQATQLTADLSVAWGTDLSGAAVKVGKALNDPVAGMTALSKVGVTFTAEQKETIKTLVATGDVLGAQKVILAELETQVGGSAAAYGETMAGQVDKARNSLLNAGASIVSVAAPALNLLATAVGAVGDFLSGLPQPLQVAVGGVLLFAAALGPVLTLVANFKSIAGPVKSAIGGLSDAASAAGGGFKAFGSFLSSAASALGPWGLAVIGAGIGLGVLVGWLSQGKSRLEEATDAAKKWAEETVKATLRAGTAESNLDALVSKQQILKASLAEVTEEYERARAVGAETAAQQGQMTFEERQRVDELNIAMEVRKTKLEGLAGPIAKLREEVRTANAVAAEEARLLRDLAVLQQGVTVATESQIQSITELNNAYLAAQGGALGYEAAQLQVESAQKRVDELIASGSLPTSLEYREATNALEQAKLGAANAAFTMQASEGSLANLLKEKGVPGLIALRDSLLNTIRTHGDASGAVQVQVDKINDLIGRTGAYDGSHATGNVNTNDQATPVLDSILEKLRRVSLGAEAAVTIRENWLRAGGPNVWNFGGGGVVPGPLGSPHMAIVHGGELVVPPGETMTGTKGQVAYYITVNVAPGASPAEVGAQTVDAIRQYERVAGKSWRS